MVRYRATALAVAFALPCPAFAQDTELTAIREEIRHLKEACEGRIQEL